MLQFPHGWHKTPAQKKQEKKIWQTVDLQVSAAFLRVQSTLTATIVKAGSRFTHAAHKETDHCVYEARSIAVG